ncbi:hypothetical protein FVEN_g13215 [Fusarium venenatum]|nr:hypothetical protein FVEN_g13215 [Fusarium venenatum]
MSLLFSTVTISRYSMAIAALLYIACCFPDLDSSSVMLSEVLSSTASVSS